MLQITRIIYITIVLSAVSPIIDFDSDTRLAGVDSQCRGTACATPATAPKLSIESLAAFILSPTQLLLTGVALLAIRSVAKKLLLRNPK